MLSSSKCRSKTYQNKQSIRIRYKDQGQKECDHPSQKTSDKQHQNNPLAFAMIMKFVIFGAPGDGPGGVGPPPAGGSYVQLL